MLIPIHKKCGTLLKANGACLKCKDECVVKKDREYVDVPTHAIQEGRENGVIAVRQRADDSFFLLTLAQLGLDNSCQISSIRSKAEALDLQLLT